MRRTVIAVVLVLAAVSSARAQAWLPSKGEATLSLIYSDSFVDRHDLSGVSDPNSDIYTRSMMADVTFGVRDNLAISVSIPVVHTRFVGAGTPPHPTYLDDGSWHTTITDFRVDVRYTALRRRGLVVTPFATTVTPSHGYEFFAHAAPGRRVNELQVGTYVGTTVDRLLPGMFVQARYAYGVQERFVNFSHNRSLGAIETGYFATPDIRVFGMINGQRTHGGVDITPRSRFEWPAIQWVNHDRITKESLVQAGAGVGWTISDALDVSASYSTALYSRNTHVLDRALIFGTSIRLQKSSLERGILSVNSGRRIARCVCQKALALQR